MSNSAPHPPLARAQTDALASLAVALVAPDAVTGPGWADTLLRELAISGNANRWAVGLAFHAVQSFSDPALPTPAQVYADARAAATFARALFPDLTPGLVADLAEFAIARVDTPPLGAGPVATLQGALALLAWSVLGLGQGAGAYLREIVAEVGEALGS